MFENSPFCCELSKLAICDPDYRDFNEIIALQTMIVGAAIREAASLQGKPGYEEALAIAEEESILLQNFGIGTVN